MQFLTNSVINPNLPQAFGEKIEDPTARAIYEIISLAFQNLLAQLEQYSGFTQKDVTTWSSIKPTDTLLAHQLRRFYVNNVNIKCTQALAFGDMVNIWNNAGVSSVQKANAVSGGVLPARGFCSTVGGIPVGGLGEIILCEGLLNIVGVNPGDKLYLSKAVAGAVVANVPPAAVGDLEQCVGFGLDVNLAYIHIVPGTYIQH